jgi:hypothetical protein
MRYRIAVVVLLTMASVSLGLVVGYKVEPVKAAWSGATDTIPPNNKVSQILTCCWDSLGGTAGGYVELFQGDTGTGSQYKLDIYEYPEGTRVAGNPGQHAATPTSWLQFPVEMVPGESFVKGRKYSFTFTRSGQDSVQYYFDASDPYDNQYGWMKIGTDGVVLSA